MLSDYIISTNIQKIIRFLLLKLGKSYHERDIARKSGVSYGSANKILNQLYKDKILQRKSAGKMFYYNVEISNEFIREYKILNNLLLLEPLINKMKPVTYKVVLFGSWASGTDTDQSDIDLFIVSSRVNDAKIILDKFSDNTGKKLQTIIKTPEDILDTQINKRDEIFMKQVEQGKVLWERETDENNL